MFTFVGLLIGLFMVVMWFFLRRQAQASLRWPSVPGRIIDSRLVSTRNSDGVDGFEPSITYAYVAGGMSLQANRVTIGGYKTRSLLQKYPAGTDVQVFYDPNKPASAVLEPGGRGLTVLLIIGIGVMIFGIVMGIVAGGSNTVSYSAATDLYKQGKFVEAKPMFEQLAQDGKAEAKVYLGVMYAKGQGVPQDFVEAQKWFILAGDAGKKNRAEIQKGITPAQEVDAENKAAAWVPK